MAAPAQAPPAPPTTLAALRVIILPVLIQNCLMLIQFLQYLQNQRPTSTLAITPVIHHMLLLAMVLDKESQASLAGLQEAVLATNESHPFAFFMHTNKVYPHFPKCPIPQRASLIFSFDRIWALIATILLLKQFIWDSEKVISLIDSQVLIFSTQLSSDSSFSGSNPRAIRIAADYQSVRCQSLISNYTFYHDNLYKKKHFKTNFILNFFCLYL